MKLCLALIILMLTSSLSLAAWDLYGPECILRVSEHVLDPIPPTPDGSSDQNINRASIAAIRGSSFWAYIQSTQGRIDWRPVLVMPDVPESDLIWMSGYTLVFQTEAGPVVGEIIFAAGCDSGMDHCQLVTTPCRIDWSDITSTTARAGSVIRGYVGTPRLKVRSHGVTGITLEVSP